MPHIIEFLSYIFNFQGIIVGPLSFYQDYIDFITGNNILKHERVISKIENLFEVKLKTYCKSKKFDSGDDEASKNIIVQPSNTVSLRLKKTTENTNILSFLKVPILKKLCTLIIVAIIFFKLAIAYPMTSNLSKENYQNLYFSNVFVTFFDDYSKMKTFWRDLYGTDLSICTYQWQVNVRDTI